MNMNSQIQNKSVLIIGASGGIGVELTRACLEAGARHVYAASRQPPARLPESASFVHLDVAARDSVMRAAAQVGSEADIVINSSGVNLNSRLIDIAPGGARAEMEVNYFGLLNVFDAFAPLMKARRAGAFVNILSSLAHANLPTMATYCASKAAALSLTQAMRAELAPFGVRVCAVLPPLVDTKMSAVSTAPKMSPADAANEIVQGFLSGAEDIYPGHAAQLREALQKDWKAVERLMASRLPPAPPGG
jgi:NAD(P)-dependent dehydrogenase (short-subunit alcohol dehydrogenase family)